MSYNTSTHYTSSYIIINTLNTFTEIIHLVCRHFYKIWFRLEPFFSVISQIHKKLLSNCIRYKKKQNTDQKRQASYYQTIFSFSTNCQWNPSKIPTTKIRIWNIRIWQNNSQWAIEISVPNIRIWLRRIIPTSTIHWKTATTLITGSTENGYKLRESGPKWKSEYYVVVTQVYMYIECVYILAH